MTHSSEITPGSIRAIIYGGPTSGYDAHGLKIEPVSKDKPKPVEAPQVRDDENQPR